MTLSVRGDPNRLCSGKDGVRETKEKVDNPRMREGQSQVHREVVPSVGNWVWDT